jgi:hypothetical protein
LRSLEDLTQLHHLLPPKLHLSSSLKSCGFRLWKPTCPYGKSETMTRKSLRGLCRRARRAAACPQDSRPASSSPKMHVALLPYDPSPQHSQVVGRSHVRDGRGAEIVARGQRKVISGPQQTNVFFRGIMNQPCGMHGERKA